MTIKVLCLPRYSRLSASSRLRFQQYKPWMTAAGIDCTESVFFDDDYLRAFYGGGNRLLHALAGYRRRIGVLRAARSSNKPDIYWIHLEALPWLPYWFERTLLAESVPYVLDYDDAWFHRYDAHPSALVRWFLADKLSRLMVGAALVIAGNSYLADYARAAGARRVERLPTVVDLDRYPIQLPQQSKRLVIGWIGTPNTAKHIGLLRGPLRKLAERHRFELRLIGVSEYSLPGVKVRCFPWEEATEAAQVSRFDIGVMPLPDEPFERGKCGYKLIQYMSCSKPVVASPVGMNGELVRDGVNGFLAAGESEWLESLSRLATDFDLRRRMGAAGRTLVEQDYCIKETGPRLVRWLQECSALPVGLKQEGRGS